LSEENAQPGNFEEEDETKPLDPLDLTARDIAIFKLAHEHRYIVYSQIREGFWKNRTVSAKTCYKRVERLVRSGFLDKGYSSRKSLDVYFVTAKSFKILQDRGLDSGLMLYEPTEWFDRSIDHDLKVLNLRILFRDLGLDSWTSERVARDRDHLKKVPDGILNIGGKRIAIEFENLGLTKQMVRYQAMLNYYRQHENYVLLFLIIDGDVKDWLVTVMDYDVKRVWITTYRELTQKKGDAVFENKAASFALCEIL